MKLLGLLLLTAGAATAGEYALLANGTRMHLDRHEVDGSRVRLYNGEGYIEMPAGYVNAFEVEEAPPPQQPPAAVPAPEPPPVVTPTPTELADAAADKYGLPRPLVRAVMAAESGFQQDVVSSKGAIGLMQLTPETAQLLGADPHDPVQNVDAGVRYLRDLLLRYDSYLSPALAAYNAGPGAVDKYHGIPPYRETIDYVRYITRTYQAKQAGEKP